MAQPAGRHHDGRYRSAGDLRRLSSVSQTHQRSVVSSDETLSCHLRPGGLPVVRRHCHGSHVYRLVSGYGEGSGVVHFLPPSTFPRLSGDESNHQCLSAQEEDYKLKTKALCYFSMFRPPHEEHFERDSSPVQ